MPPKGVSGAVPRLLSLVLVLVLLSVSGCTAADGRISDPVPTTPPTVASDVLSARGQIVSEMPATQTLDDPDHVIGGAKRAVYRSASGVDGGAREVSGLFFTPRGTPPARGWPVVAFAHGTTGIAPDCGPSQFPDALGFLSVAMSYLREGYAVAMTDYEGLGHPGRHPYLEPRTAAFNVIDSVRALRELFPGVSEQWAALGNSQGGQAAWSADELADSYGDGLDLVGAVALSPAANVTALADLVDSRSLSDDQRDVLPLMVVGLGRSFPDARDRLRVQGVSADNEDELFSCRSGSAPRFSADAVVIDDVDVFRDTLRRIALPQAPLTAPLLVVNGQADNLIPPQWVTAAVDQACSRRGIVDHIEVENAGHGDLGGEAYRLVSDWLGQRFDSRRVPSTCGRSADIVPLA